MLAKHYVIFAALVAVAIAEVADFTKCSDHSDDICEVSEIRITPCKNSKVCKIKKGTSPSMSFDYTPKFSCDKLKTGLFWASDSGDVPFPALYDADACELTSCPIEANKKYELNHTLKLSKKLPQGKFIFKWKLWNADNPSQSCCLQTNVELR
ncbi:unnamed protein product, partial [Brenthis ino]